LSAISPPSFVRSNTIYETITGSVAYGVSSDDSDCDIIGYCLPPVGVVFPHVAGHIEGFGRQKQTFKVFNDHHIQDPSRPERSYDFSIYNIVHYFQLCMENNPNMVDSLYTPRECVLHSTRVSERVREHRDLFLHKGCWHKFKGYAYSQLHKMGSHQREGKRAKLHDEFGFDVKFAYHVVRLLYEAEMILNEHTLDLRRHREHLKAIRRGEVTEDDIRKWAAEKETALERAYENSTLRYSPDQEAIKTLLLECLEDHYGSLDKLISRPSNKALTTDANPQLFSVTFSFNGSDWVIHRVNDIADDLFNRLLRLNDDWHCGDTVYVVIESDPPGFEEVRESRFVGKLDRRALDIHDALRLAGHLDNLGMESPNSIGDVDFFLDQLTVKGHAARIDTEESKTVTLLVSFSDTISRRQKMRILLLLEQSNAADLIYRITQATDWQVEDVSTLPGALVVTLFDRSRRLQHEVMLVETDGRYEIGTLNSAEIEFMAHDHVSLAYMEGDWLNKASRPYRDVFDDREKAEEVMAELLVRVVNELADRFQVTNYAWRPFRNKWMVKYDELFHSVADALAALECPGREPKFIYLLFYARENPACYRLPSIAEFDNQSLVVHYAMGLHASGFTQDDFEVVKHRLNPTGNSNDCVQPAVVATIHYVAPIFRGLAEITARITHRNLAGTLEYIREHVKLTPEDFVAGKELQLYDLKFFFDRGWLYLDTTNLTANEEFHAKHMIDRKRAVVDQCRDLCKAIAA
ncbi:Uncharacterized protein SCF082_LOCUS35995, partial [Durusdinium trenchii]